MASLSAAHSHFVEKIQHAKDLLAVRSVSKDQNAHEAMEKLKNCVWELASLMPGLRAAVQSERNTLDTLLVSWAAMSTTSFK